MLRCGHIRLYYSRRMRGQQSAVSRMDNLFSPIRDLIDEESPDHPGNGSYQANRRSEQLTSPFPSVSKFIESSAIGLPRTSGARRAMLGKRTGQSAPLFLDQFRPKVEFVGTELPLATLPEVAFVGRSNVGKSSLINAIVGRKCCRVENKPGSTESFAFFKVGDPPLISLVDIPGFGFAYVPETVRTERSEFALNYLKSRKNLSCAVLVVDARHGLGDSDLELLAFFKRQKLTWKIALNKVDLVEGRVLAKRITRIGTDLGIAPNKVLETIVPVSAMRVQGIDFLREIVGSFKLKRDVVIAGKRRRIIDLLELRRLSKRSAAAPVCGSAYQPDATSIVKRTSPIEEGIRLLDPTHFVSQDELDNLGTKQAARNGNIKTRHLVESKMKLVNEPAEKKPPKKNPVESNFLDYISTQSELESVPKGIAKWRIPGLKPRIKTARFRPRLDTAAHISKMQQK